MTDSFCKLASGIILSTIWREDDHTRILWITMLAVKGRDHRVLASVPGLAAVANLPIASVRAGLQKLMSPDPDSRTKDHEGRRIIEIEGGWFVVNGEKYRNYMSKAERNEYQARLMATRRKKLAPVSTVRSKLAPLAQAEAEAEAEVQKGSIVELKLDEVRLMTAARGLLAYLNEKAGKSYREIGTHLKLIVARLREEGVTPDDVKQMIDRKVREWRGTEQEKYLRPETLFNKTKFASYYDDRNQPVLQFGTDGKPRPKTLLDKQVERLLNES